MNNKILILIIGLLIFSSGIYAQEILDIGLEIGFQENSLTGFGVDKSLDKNGIITINFLVENAFLKIIDNIFTNIVPNTQERAYIKLDQDLKIVQADFTVSENGGNYNFKNETIEVPNGTRVYFSNETGLELTFPNNVDLTKFPNLLNYLISSKELKIKGKRIQLPNEIYLIEGEISVNSKGYLIEKGLVNYKQNLFEVLDEDNQILIANLDSDLSNYGGNWIKQGEKTLELQSFDSGRISVEFLEGHEILNMDNKDRLEINLSLGDGLLIKNRNEKGLIPEIFHKSSEEGSTYFENDKLMFEFDKNGFSMDPTKPLTLEDIQSGKYQSVAMEITPDSPNISEKLRINSYRQFCILSKDNEELVTFNKYELPCSALLKDNEIQTIDQLREKYHGIEFEINKEDYPEESIPPYLLYITDNFLKINPKAVQNIRTIQYNDQARMYVQIGTNDLMTGRKIVDTSESKFSRIREITGPLQIFTHEYEHVSDIIINEEEIKELKNLNDPILNGIIEERNTLKKELELFIESRESYNGNKYSLEFLKLKNEIISKGFDLLLLDSKIRETSLNNHKKETLQQKYNELVEGAIEKIDNKRFRKQLIKLGLDLENHIGKELERILREEGTDIKSYVKTNYGNAALKDMKRDPSSYYYKITLALVNSRNLASPEVAPLIKNLDETTKNLARLNILSKSSIKFKDSDFSGKSAISYFMGYSSFFPDLKRYKNRIENIIRTKTGLPYQYALEMVGGSYKELSSTYREIPIEERARLVNSANRNIRNTFTILTQLAFDSGKMDVEEYKVIMGERYCKKADCSDQLCVEYKYLCCINNPEVPNCKG